LGNQNADDVIVLKDAGGLSRLQLGVDSSAFGSMNSLHGLKFISDTDNNSAVADFIWGTDALPSGAYTELMRLTSSGNVGIGTTNPGSYKLNVNGNTNITGTLNVTSSVTANSFIGPVVGTLVADNVSSGDFGANTLGGDYSFPGNLGIGTTNPRQKLELSLDPTNTSQPTGIYGSASDPHTALFISGTGNANNEKVGIQFGIYSSAGNKYGIGGMYGLMTNVAGNTIGDLTFDVRRLTTDNSLTEAMRITSAGNVGIGTTNPQYKLEVNNGNDAAPTAVFKNSNTTYGPQFVLDATSGGLGGEYRLVSRGGSNMFSVWSAGSGGYALNVLATGNVGIGTTNPGTYRLKVAGDMAITGTLQTQTGSDFAEEFSVNKDLPSGTVVVMADGGHKAVAASSQAYDRTVVGIVSDNPSIIAGRVDSEKKVVVAMVGVVSVRVNNSNGAVVKGDLLTTSNITGYAMKASEFKPGTIIGKALEDLNGKSGQIKVLVNLQ